MINKPRVNTFLLVPSHTHTHTCHAVGLYVKDSLGLFVLGGNKMRTQFLQSVKRNTERHRERGKKIHQIIATRARAPCTRFDNMKYSDKHFEVVERPLTTITSTWKRGPAHSGHNNDNDNEILPMFGPADILVINRKHLHFGQVFSEAQRFGSKNIGLKPLYKRIKRRNQQHTQHVLALRNNIDFIHLGHIFLTEP